MNTNKPARVGRNSKYRIIFYLQNSLFWMNQAMYNKYFVVILTIFKIILVESEHQILNLRTDFYWLSYDCLISFILITSEKMPTLLLLKEMFYIAIDNKNIFINTLFEYEI